MSRTIIYVVLALWASSQSVDAVNCTTAGRFADDSVADCQGYVLCVLNTDGLTYLQYSYTCPTTSVFNPNTALCTASTNYSCNTTETTTTTTDSTTTVSTSVCTEDGFVADSSSTDCTAYIQCVSINDTFTETSLTCPTDTYYDPSTTLCSTTYECTTTTTTVATTTVATTTVATFTCTDAGRFADTSVSGCQSYFLCVLQTDGTYVSYTYTCPTTSVFNPSSSVCTSSYTCTT